MEHLQACFPLPAQGGQVALSTEATMPHLSNPSSPSESVTITSRICHVALRNQFSSPSEAPPNRLKREHPEPLSSYSKVPAKGGTSHYTINSLAKFELYDTSLVLLCLLLLL